MEIKIQIDEAVNHPAWTQRHLDGTNVKVSHREVAPSCYIITREYKKES